MITGEGIEKSYGSLHVLKGVDFEVKKGETDRVFRETVDGLCDDLRNRDSFEIEERAPNWAKPKFKGNKILRNTFNVFGGATFAQLAARANITVPAGNYSTAPVVNGGVCDKTVLTNWGDGMNPLGACANYFPIIHATGTITLNNTQGQGILLVDGDLNVQGSYQFFGIVVIQGDLKTAGGGSTDAHFWGGVMAKNADLSVQNLSGKATLNYSSCSINAVLQATSPISMMRSRGWVQLY